MFLKGISTKTLNDIAKADRCTLFCKPVDIIHDLVFTKVPLGQADLFCSKYEF